MYSRRHSPPVFALPDKQSVGRTATCVVPMGIPAALTLTVHSHGNRLDAIVSFKALDEEIILRVVDKFLLQLESQLAEKKVEVTFTDALRKHLAKKGFDPLMGARPMQRLIQDTIRRALADELLFGRLVDGGRLTVDVDAEGKPVLDIQPAKKIDKPKAEAATA